jgi:GNAT superfamily N-acetyltransferase
VRNPATSAARRARTSRFRARVVSHGSVSVRPMEERDLEVAAAVVQLAFGAFLGVATPFGDRDLVRTRFRADPASALVAEVDGHVVGSNFAAAWGSVGLFGPLTVRPDLWDRGVASRLLVSTDELFARWGTRHAGLFTFPHSPKHLALYQKFGFRPCDLTPVLTKGVRDAAGPAGSRAAAVRFRDLAPVEVDEALVSASSLTGASYDGLDVGREIRAVLDQGLGDVLALDDASGLAALAVCHVGAGTEAGSGVCYVKFGTARPGPGAEQRFGRLLDGVESYAGAAGARVVELGVNTARAHAHRAVLRRGYRTSFVGVAMERGDDEGYNRPDAWIVDDWR